MYPQQNENLHCTCQRSRKANCSLPGRCSVTNLTITRLDNNTTKTQTGCTVNFKQRYGQYNHSFTHINGHLGHCCSGSTLQSSYRVLWFVHWRKIQNYVWTWRCITKLEVRIFCLLLSSKTSTSHQFQARKFISKFLTFQN